ncbi:MAG: TM2 domain-containing protein [Pseudomonadota bacterium]
MDNLHKEMVFEANRKSKGVAYLLWVLCGFFGVHRFYAGETKTGAIQLVMAFSVIGWPFLLIWLLIDLFLIPDMINEKNMALIHALNHDDPPRDRRRDPHRDQRRDPRGDPRGEISDQSEGEPVLDSKRARMIEELRASGYRKEPRDLSNLYR